MSWNHVGERKQYGMKLGELYRLTDDKQTVGCRRVKVTNCRLTRRIVDREDLRRAAYSANLS